MKFHTMIRLAFVLIIFSAGPSRALIFEAAALVGGGSLVIGKAGREANRSIDKAKNAALAVIAKGEESGNNLLAQVSALEAKIADDLLKSINAGEDAILRVLDTGAAEAALLTDDIYQKMNNLISRTECSVQVSVIEEARRLLGKAGSVISSSEQIVFSPTGRTTTFGRPLSLSISLFPMDQAYRDVKTFYEEDLLYVQEETSLDGILEAYSFMERLANRATCYDTGDKIRFVREAMEHRRFTSSINSYFYVPIGE